MGYPFWGSGEAGWVGYPIRRQPDFFQGVGCPNGDGDQLQWEILKDWYLRLNGGSHFQGCTLGIQTHKNLNKRTRTAHY